MLTRISAALIALYLVHSAETAPDKPHPVGGLSAAIAEVQASPAVRFCSEQAKFCREAALAAVSTRIAGGNSAPAREAHPSGLDRAGLTRLIARLG